MPINARRFVRKMRGGAQSHLIEADDDRTYIVKFQNNPQHRRILINELIASTFLRYLQIATPETAIVNVSRQFLDDNPEVHIQLGTTRSPITPGWHFGSCYPGDPARTAVYDFLPDVLLGQVSNPTDFMAMLAFDKWSSNSDARQSIFVRARLRQFVPSSSTHPLKLGFVALMMDHGFIFDGPHWNYTDSPIQGLYFRTSVYRNVRGWDDFQPWLEQIANFPESVVDDALKQIPAEWMDGDGGRLQALLEKLMTRRKRVAGLIQECSRGRVNPFPNWQ